MTQHAFGLQYDVLGTDIPETWRTSVAQQAHALEEMPPPGLRCQH